MKNFDEKIRLGAILRHLQNEKEKLVEIKEKYPCAILHSFGALNELQPIIGEAGYEVIRHSCEEVIGVCIDSIDRKFEEQKAEFEQLEHNDNEHI